MRAQMDKEHLPSLPANIPQLARDVVHVWVMSLELPRQERDHCLSLLSADEKTRAEKFYFEKARDHFIAGRGLLRTLLGGYLEVEPAEIQFDDEPQGKPILKDQSIQFNVSHSDGLGVVAVCWDRRVGVDIEWHRPLADMDDLARRFFTANESALLASLSWSGKQELFYKLWTCKEAYLKAVGAGLFIPLDQVEVKFEADGGVHLISKEGIEMNEWQLRMFSPHVKYQSAVCVEGGGIEIVVQSLGH